MKGFFRPLEDYLRFLRGVALWLGFFFVSASLFFISKSYAEGLFEYGKAKLGGTYAQFTGPEQTSLGGNASLGFGVELDYSRGNSVFALVGKIRTEYGLGQNTFSDGATDRSLNFKTLTGTASLGLSVNLIPGKQLFFLRPYIGGAGTAGFAFLHFTDNITLTSLSRTDTQLTYGYMIFMGVDFATKHSNSGFYVEVQLQFNYARLAGQTPLHIDGFRFVAGVAWF
jgi:opacity protein-like surface antigen